MRLLKFFSLFCLLVIGCNAYEILLFSDVHYDGLEYRSEPVPENQRAALRRNLRSWEQELPALLRAANVQCQQKKIDFAVVLGDLIHGYFASPSLHAEGLEKIIGILQSSLSCQVYVIKGNHDIAGAYGRDAFQASARPLMHQSFKQSGIGVGPANYTLNKNNDLFIFFDCMEPDLKFIEEALQSAQNLRHIFLFTHYPVLPSSPNGNVSILFAGTNTKELLKNN